MKLFLMESSLQLKWLLWFNHKEVKPLYDNLVATGSQYLESNTVKYRKLSTTKIIKFYNRNVHRDSSSYKRWFKTSKKARQIFCLRFFLIMKEHNQNFYCMSRTAQCRRNRCRRGKKFRSMIENAALNSIYNTYFAFRFL